MGIPNIPAIQVHSTQIPDQTISTVQQPYVPNFNPITNYIGFPIVYIPGCVNMHKDNKRHKNGVPIDKSLIENDPGTVMTLCPTGEYPSFNAMNYEPEQLTIIRETPPPPVAPPNAFTLISSYEVLVFIVVKPCRLSPSIVKASVTVFDKLTVSNKSVLEMLNVTFKVALAILLLF